MFVRLGTTSSDGQGLLPSLHSRIIPGHALGNIWETGERTSVFTVQSKSPPCFSISAATSLRVFNHINLQSKNNKILKSISCSRRKISYDFAFVLQMLKIEPRAPNMHDKHFSTDLHPQTQFMYIQKNYIMEIWDCSKNAEEMLRKCQSLLFLVE